MKVVWGNSGATLSLNLLVSSLPIQVDLRKLSAGFS